MTPLNGWDGPDCIDEGLFRYSRYLSWIRLYIEIEGDEFRGGICGTSGDIEIVREEGKWMRYATSPAWTAAGEPVLLLRGYTTWEMVYERISEGVPLDEEIETIEDLALCLERCAQ
jgi:hypothetical protein